MIVRMYRHIKMLKRSGRGHDPRGAKATSPGECAVLCPACPQPGMNLPEGWEKVPAEYKYVSLTTKFAHATKLLLDSYIACF